MNWTQLAQIGLIITMVAATLTILVNLDKLEAIIKRRIRRLKRFFQRCREKYLLKKQKKVQMIKQNKNKKQGE